MLLWVITRITENPITGRAGPISGEAITIQVFQIAFIILSRIVLVKIQKLRIAELKLLEINRYTINIIIYPSDGDQKL